MEEMEHVVRSLIGTKGICRTFDSTLNATGDATGTGSGLKEAMKWASEQGEMVVIAGSLYLAGDFYRIRRTKFWD